MSADQWYFRHDGRAIGPVPAKKLRGFIEAGKLDWDARVRCGEEPWRIARDCVELTRPNDPDSRTAAVRSAPAEPAAPSPSRFEAARPTIDLEEDRGQPSGRGRRGEAPFETLTPDVRSYPRRAEPIEVETRYRAMRLLLTIYSYAALFLVVLAAASCVLGAIVLIILRETSGAGMIGGGLVLLVWAWIIKMIENMLRLRLDTEENTRLTAAYAARQLDVLIEIRNGLSR